ncbi:hypothetical protein B0H17DRAFT_1137719 [Mycena rosella]|uniref:Uncharacterized protein n=1 Tax=Mycena rosella TaxID=1033263 RepID=A0AAD7GD71_MYCRO|nr:hypothetical protein B0H17DRAFT_1137719 [Mycena rosella]
MYLVDCRDIIGFPMPEVCHHICAQAVEDHGNEDTRRVGSEGEQNNFGIMPAMDRSSNEKEMRLQIQGSVMVRGKGALVRWSAKDMQNPATPRMISPMMRASSHNIHDRPRPLSALEFEPAWGGGDGGWLPTRPKALTRRIQKTLANMRVLQQDDFGGTSHEEAGLELSDRNLAPNEKTAAKSSHDLGRRGEEGENGGGDLEHVVDLARMLPLDIARVIIPLLFALLPFVVQTNPTNSPVVASWRASTVAGFTHIQPLLPILLLAAPLSAPATQSTPASAVAAPSSIAFRHGVVRLAYEAQCDVLAPVPVQMWAHWSRNRGFISPHTPDVCAPSVCFEPLPVLPQVPAPPIIYSSAHGHPAPAISEVVDVSTKVGSYTPPTTSTDALDLVPGPAAPTASILATVLVAQLTVSPSPSVVATTGSSEVVYVNVARDVAPATTVILPAFICLVLGGLVLAAALLLLRIPGETLWRAQAVFHAAQPGVFGEIPGRLIAPPVLFPPPRRQRVPATPTPSPANSHAAATQLGAAGNGYSRDGLGEFSVAPTTPAPPPRSWAPPRTPAADPLAHREYTPTLRYPDRAYGSCVRGPPTPRNPRPQTGPTMMPSPSEPVSPLRLGLLARRDPGVFLCLDGTPVASSAAQAPARSARRDVATRPPLLSLSPSPSSMQPPSALSRPPAPSPEPAIPKTLPMNTTPSFPRMSGSRAEPAEPALVHAFPSSSPAMSLSELGPPATTADAAVPIEVQAQSAVLNSRGEQQMAVHGTGLRVEQSVLVRWQRVPPLARSVYPAPKEIKQQEELEAAGDERTYGQADGAEAEREAAPATESTATVAVRHKKAEYPLHRQPTQTADARPASRLHLRPNGNGGGERVATEAPKRVKAGAVPRQPLAGAHALDPRPSRPPLHPLNGAGPSRLGKTLVQAQVRPEAPKRDDKGQSNPVPPAAGPSWQRTNLTQVPKREEGAPVLGRKASTKALAAGDNGKAKARARVTIFGHILPTFVPPPPSLVVSYYSDIAMSASVSFARQGGHEYVEKRTAQSRRGVAAPGAGATVASTPQLELDVAAYGGREG